MEKDKILYLEKILMTLSSKYNFTTQDHNNCYDLICEILDEVDINNLHQLGTKSAFSSKRQNNRNL